MCQHRATRLVRQFVVPMAALVVATHAGAAGANKPLLLRGMGSFYVGGQRTEIQHSAGGRGQNRPGHIWDGAMYGHYMIPATAPEAGASFPSAVPVLLMAGDPIDPKAAPPFGIEGCKTVAAAHPELKLTVDYLPDAGIRGNSHMMMLDRNNKQIADRIMRWIAHQRGWPQGRRAEPLSH